MLQTKIFVENKYGEKVFPFSGSAFPLIVENYFPGDNEKIYSFIECWNRKGESMMTKFSLTSVPVVQLLKNGLSKHSLGVLRHKNYFPGRVYKPLFTTVPFYDSGKKLTGEDYIQFVDNLRLEKDDELTISTVLPQVGISKKSIIRII